MLSSYWNFYIRLMRWDKPIGFGLLLFPVINALWTAQQGIPESRWLLVFALGVVLTRSAGCVINDLVDCRWDGHVARTQHRPLIQHPERVVHAYVLLGVLALACLSLLYVLNPISRGIALVAAVATIIYPYTKRFLAVPQAWLGLTFNAGILMAFATVHHLNPTAWLLYTAGFFWTLAYDTQYAMADLPDDRRLNLHSSALTLGTYAATAVLCFQHLHLGMYAAWALYHQKMWILGGCLLAELSVLWQHRHMTRHQNTPNYRDACFNAFKHNALLGLCLSVSIVIQWR